MMFFFQRRFFRLVVKCSFTIDEKFAFFLNCFNLIFYANFLTKTSELRKGKLLVVVSFFVYFSSDAFRLLLRLLQGINTTNN